MIEYPKIDSLYKRNEKSHKFEISNFKCSEFEYLYSLPWIWTEKIDGTNIRIEWIDEKINIGGRTAKAQIPTFLNIKLEELFPSEKFKQFESPLCLFGEGFGSGIQRGGAYIPEGGCDFVLFDVLIDGWWLKREDIEDIAKKLEIKCVPIIGQGPLIKAEEIVIHGFKSQFGIGKAQAEGLVCFPKTYLRNRRGDRIITKLKTKDYI